MSDTSISIISAVISAASGIIGALIGGRAAYKAAERQIEEQRLIRKQEILEKAEVTRKVITKFLWHEINKNMELLNYPTGWVWPRLGENSKPFQHGYNSILVLNEYNKVKYDLLKYDQSLVKDVLDIYDMFTIINTHEDINKFSEVDFEGLKELPSAYEGLKEEIYHGGKTV